MFPIIQPTVTLLPYKSRGVERRRKLVLSLSDIRDWAYGFPEAPTLTWFTLDSPFFLNLPHFQSLIDLFPSFPPFVSFNGQVAALDGSLHTFWGFSLHNNFLSNRLIFPFLIILTSLHRELEFVASLRRLWLKWVCNEKSHLKSETTYIWRADSPAGAWAGVFGAIERPKGRRQNAKSIFPVGVPKGMGVMAITDVHLEVEIAISPWNCDELRLLQNRGREFNRAENTEWYRPDIFLIGYLAKHVAGWETPLCLSCLLGMGN